MNRKSTLIILNLLVLGLILLSIAGFVKLYSDKSAKNIPQVSQSDEYAYLTNQGLMSLPRLAETRSIVPTGKVKELKLEAKETEWEVLPGVKTAAVTYNGKSPGPVIRVTEGDLVRVTLKNALNEPTSIHFHGVHLPNGQDGVPPFTQKEIEPGKTFTYEFIAGHAGTYMYHPHINSVEQIDKGLYGAFIIDPQDSSENLQYDKDYIMVLGGWNLPSDSFDRKALNGANMPGHDMGETKKRGGEKETGDNDEMKMDKMDEMDVKVEMDSQAMDEGSGGTMAMDYNFWTINGKAFPATEKITIKKGQRVRIRLINISNASHPMHLHGTDFRIIAEDSHPLSEPRIVNTIDVAPGKTFDIDFVADNPGRWVFHCHELHHTENDGVEPGGLMTVIEYEVPKDGQKGKRSLDMTHTNM